MVLLQVIGILSIHNQSDENSFCVYSFSKLEHILCTKVFMLKINLLQNKKKLHNSVRKLFLITFTNTKLHSISFEKIRYFLKFWVVTHLKFKEYIKESFTRNFYKLHFCRICAIMIGIFSYR